MFRIMGNSSGPKDPPPSPPRREYLKNKYVCIHISRCRLVGAAASGAEKRPCLLFPFMTLLYILCMAAGWLLFGRFYVVK